MYPIIFTRISYKTQKHPKRIKVFSDGRPEYYLYQEELMAYENHALACQHFCNIKGLHGKYYAATDKDGVVFVKINEFCWLDESTNFNEEE